MKLFVTIILCILAREENSSLQSLEKGMRWSGKFEIGPFSRIKIREPTLLRISKRIINLGDSSRVALEDLGRLSWNYAI